MKHKTPRRAGKYPKFTLKDTLRGTITPERNCFDVYYYNLSIDVDIEDQFVKGYVDIYFTANEPTNKIQIDLYENLKADSIVYDSNILNYNRLHDAVYVSFNKTLNKGESATIRFYYQGKPVPANKPPWEGGFVWKTDKQKRPWIGVSCELDGASLWWPVKDVLNDEPDSMKIQITIPKDLICVSNGIMLNKETKDEKETFTWFTNYPINTYNTTIYIGKFEKFTIPYKSAYTEFDMDFYVLPENVEVAKKHFEQTTQIIQFYEMAFGEYPWVKNGYKLIESPYEGMEHQTAIAYGNGYKNTNFYDVDFIILHETAHDWWGNSVTATDYSDIWLHEGFATYSEALYIEHKFGDYRYYLSYLKFYAMLINNKRPLIGPKGVNYWDYKDTDVYMKGALLLHTLRNTINEDPLFFEIIKEFYQTHKYGWATTKDFVTLVNNKTHKDYTIFFNQYLNDRRCPILIHRVNFSQTSPVLEFKLANCIESFSIPVKVKIGQKDKIVWPVTNKWTQIEAGINETYYINTAESYLRVKEIK